MKKILFINTLYEPNIGGGAEIIFQKQVEGLKKRGYEVIVLTTGKNKNLFKEYVNEVLVYRAGIRNFYWHYGTYKSRNKYIKLLWHIRDSYNSKMRVYVKEVLRLEKPDLVICHNLAGFSIAVWDEIKNYKIPIVQVLHDMYMICTKSIMFKNNHTCKSQCLLCKMLRVKHKEKSEQVDILVGVSQFIINKMDELGYFKNVKKQVIYNAQNIKCIENKTLWDGKRILKIGFLGTLSQSKGIEWLIKQFNDLAINAELYIGGRGEVSYEHHLKILSKDNPKIKFVGYINSEEFYKQVDLVCIPSLLADTFPGVAYEANANKIPVIASNMGGLPEIIKDGINGLIIDPLNKNSLQMAILKLYDNIDLFKKLSSHSKMQVKNFLDIDRMLDEYEIILNY